MKLRNELILKVYATKSKSATEAGKYWYLHFHGVYYPNKPGKIRVVFNLGEKFHGTSISKSLLSRLDLTNQIFGVLLRFMEEQIAVEAMANQCIIS